MFQNIYDVADFVLDLSCAGQNNRHTRHLAKILIHLSWCLQEAIQTSGAPSPVYMKAVNAVYVSSVFLKYIIENSQSKNIEELCLSLDENEPVPKDFVTGKIFDSSSLFVYQF